METASKKITNAAIKLKKTNQQRKTKLKKMENLIDSNENNHKCDEHVRKLENNNNNNNNNEPPVSSTSPKISIPSHHNSSCLNCPTTNTNGVGSSGGGGSLTDHEDYGVDDASENDDVFHNEGLIEEIFQLPHCISDDEVSSNSDNCVYAYRGGGDVVSPEPLPQVSQSLNLNF